MKLLLKLLSFLIWAVLLAAILFGLAALSWWFGWPMGTGAVILAGLAAVILLFFACRTLWRWRNKRVFVRRVLSEQQRFEINSPISSSAIQDIWQQGMSVFDQSPLRDRLRPQYSQPWFLALDDTAGATGTDRTGTGPFVFSEFGRNLPERDTLAPLAWHFLPGSVMLRFSDTQKAEETDDAWETLLTLLAHNHRKTALKGLVIQLSASIFMDSSSSSRESSESLRARGQRLRSRVQQVMLTLSRRFPVYVLVQDMERLPGMAELGRRLPINSTDAPLGCLLDRPEAAPGAHAAAHAVAALKDAICVAAEADVPPHGDELLALEQLAALGDRLDVLLEQAFKDLPHQARPVLRGVHFAHSRSLAGHNADTFFFNEEDNAPSSNLQRPRFLSDLLTHVIPGDAFPTPALHSRFTLYATTKTTLMAGWLLLLLFVCGAMGVNTMYQHHVLATVPVQSNGLSHLSEVNMLYTKMTHIRYLEKARNAWYLPTFGQDMLGLVIRRAKSNFVAQTFAGQLRPVLLSITNFLSNPATESRPQDQVDVAKQLRWLCYVTADRLLGEDPHSVDTPFPLTAFNHEQWTPVQGELIKTMMGWITDENELRRFSENMQQLLVLSLSRKGSDLQTMLVNNIDEYSPSARVCLSQFWQHLAAGSAEDSCVPPRYTQAGYAQLQESLDDMLVVSGHNPLLQQEIRRFLDTYFREYASAWKSFTAKSGKVSNTMLHSEAFAAYAGMQNIERMPQVLLLQRLGKELAPLLESEIFMASLSQTPTAQAVSTQPLPWAKQVQLINTMIPLALASKGTDATLWDRMLMLVQSSPNTLATLRAATQDTAQLREVLEGVTGLNLYFATITELTHSLASPAQALPIAALHFGGPTADASKSPFTLAEKQLASALKSVPGGDGTPGKLLLYDMLETVKQGLTVETAKALQHSWEIEVLGSPANLYAANSEVLYGPEGVVSVFMNTHLKPFVSRRGSALVSANWGRLSFPFTTDFLVSLTRAEAVAAAPAPRESYPVLLRSQPTLVNIEARKRPDTTTVSLQCEGKNLQLTNRNYPREQTFDYNVEKCGKTDLRIQFPGFELTRNYASFADLLEEFQYGERQFSAQDFPDSAKELAAAQVENITVRLLPDNIAEVLARKNNSQPVLQDRITYVW